MEWFPFNPEPSSFLNDLVNENQTCKIFSTRHFLIDNLIYYVINLAWHALSPLPLSFIKSSVFLSYIKAIHNYFWEVDLLYKIMCHYICISIFLGKFQYFLAQIQFSCPHITILTKYNFLVKRQLFKPK